MRVPTFFFLLLIALLAMQTACKKTGSTAMGGSTATGSFTTTAPAVTDCGKPEIELKKGAPLLYS
jgi:hypothetical protein